MATLFMNIGSLDARKCSQESADQIKKLKNVGSLIVTKENRSYFLNVNMENVGAVMEMDEDAKVSTGPLTITKEMLETAKEPLKISLIGPLSFTPDITPELLDQKLAWINVVGPVEVYDHFAGIFMNKLDKIVGPINTIKVGEISLKGPFIFTNAFLQELNDDSEITCSGLIELAEDMNNDLFDQKIKTIKIKRQIKIFDDQKDIILQKVNEDLSGTKSKTRIGYGPAKFLFKEENRSKLIILFRDYEYLPAGTKVDSFMIANTEKKVISSEGHLILSADITEEILMEKGIKFSSSCFIYFPQQLQKTMPSLLQDGSRGIPYNTETLTLISGNQDLTKARLKIMKENAFLLVLGNLSIDKDISFEEVHEKISLVDLFGSIEAGKDVISILQDKIRHNEGALETLEEECDHDNEEEEDLSLYDTVIKNLGSYTL